MKCELVFEISKEFYGRAKREMLAGMVVTEKPEEQAAQMRMEGL